MAQFGKGAESSNLDQKLSRSLPPSDEFCANNFIDTTKTDVTGVNQSIALPTWA